ncbi:MAG: aquaporin family protein, partial [Actinomycetia bacterium]|nr:aquaporin family protein [Actinomycetes bacterium]
VTLAARALGTIDTRTALAYIPTQIVGGIFGVIIANLMFELPAVNWSTNERVGAHLVLAEGVATFGLLLVIFGVVRAGQPTLAAFSVGGYIAGAYYFTSSTSFANPAVTVARMFSDTFAGIEPASAPAFVAVQLLAVGVAVVVARVIYPDVRS